MSLSASAATTFIRSLQNRSWRLDDESVLELAVTEKRVLLTRNSRDFAPLCRTWAEAGREHAGVILIWTLSHRQFTEIVAAVDHWNAEIPQAKAWRGLVVSI